MVAARKRRYGSKAEVLARRAVEATLAAIQHYNGPRSEFRAEGFLLMITTAWTLLLQAQFHRLRIDYRKREDTGPRPRLKRVATGQVHYLSLLEMIRHGKCPLDPATKANLGALTEVRNLACHHIYDRLDKLLESRIAACARNIAYYIDEWFGPRISLRGTPMPVLMGVIEPKEDEAGPAKQIKTLLAKYESDLPLEVISSDRYAIRLAFFQRLANKPGQAGRVIQFIAESDPKAGKIPTDLVVIKATEKPKWLPTKVVELMKAGGFPRFTMHHHTRLWQARVGERVDSDLGVWVTPKQWMWYAPWLELVRQYCQDHQAQFGPKLSFSPPVLDGGSGDARS